MTVRTSTLLALTVIVPLASPLAAQQRVEVGVRRAPRAEPETAERQMRRLRLRADSLTRVYHDESENLDERRRAGDALDQTVDQIDQLAMRMLDIDVRMRIEASRSMLAPMADQRAVAAMSQALTQRSAPRGWLGIVVSGAAREPWVERGELMIRYLTHPEIVSVEPSSPAERAGLVPSDTLIAYDGNDVTEGDISVTRLLKPNARVLVRIRREGRTRDVPVTISDAPRRIVIRVDERMSERSPSALSQGPAFSTAPTPVAAPSLPRIPVAAFAPLPPLLSEDREGAVAGALLQAVTPGLARSLRVKSGVLVVSVPRGSPASESGLVDGDVIVKIGGQDVHTVMGVVELVGAAVSRGEHTVAMETLREGKTRKGVLRW